MKPAGTSAALFFTFPEDSPLERRAATVEFRVEAGEYSGVVRVPRRIFQRLLSEWPPPELWVEASYLQRTRFESVAALKPRWRQLTEDGNVEISGWDLDWCNKRSLDFRRP